MKSVRFVVGLVLLLARNETSNAVTNCNSIQLDVAKMSILATDREVEPDLLICGLVWELWAYELLWRDQLEAGSFL